MLLDIFVICSENFQLGIFVLVYILRLEKLYNQGDQNGF